MSPLNHTDDLAEYQCANHGADHGVQVHSSHHIYSEKLANIRSLYCKVPPTFHQHETG